MLFRKQFWRRAAISLALHLRNLCSRAPATGEIPLTLSMTTHGTRTLLVHIALESILRSPQRPQRVILWLDDAERFKRLPRSLRRLQRRGLSVRLSENYGPHTKYYAAVQDARLREQPIATADDDIIYPRGWLAGLYEAYRAFPDCINCYRGKELAFEGLRPAPYRQWPLLLSDTPRLSHFPTGVSGVIYPPAFLRRLREAGDGFRQSCPLADDVWLHVNAVRAGFRIRQLAPMWQHYHGVPWTRGSALHKRNVRRTGNDEQILATYSASDLAAIRAALQPGAASLSENGATEPASGHHALGEREQ